MTVQPHASPYSASARPELTGGRSIGVLLSHGFTGSPFSMKPWGEYLADKGYAVEVPRLPGHGTTWQEMNRTSWTDWYGEVSRVFEKLTANHDAVVLGGLSMGGALVLRLAADHPDQVAGVVLVNPAVASDRKDLLAVPVVKYVLPSLGAIGADIKKPGMDEHAYPRTPLKALHTLMKAWKPLRTDLGKIKAPVLMFRSVEDHVVDPSSSKIILTSVASAEANEVLLEDSYHVATIDNDAERIFADSAEFIARVTA